MKRVRAKCEPLAGINNQLVVAGGTPSDAKAPKLDQNLMVNVQPAADKPKRQRKNNAAPLSLASSGSGGGSMAGSDSSSNGGAKPVQQRNAANARERQRMRVLSKAFCRLKTSLPWVPPDTKLSKLDTLRLASCYIAHLKQILDEDQASNDGISSSTAPKVSSGRSGKQNSAILSAVSASTSKLLSMALPIAQASQSGKTAPSLPVMPWPFVARGSSSSASANSTAPSIRSAPATQAKNSTSPRHVGGQLGQLYAQFKDRLLVLPQQSQPQSHIKSPHHHAPQQQQFPSPPAHSNQIFSTTPSASTASWQQTCANFTNPYHTPNMLYNTSYNAASCLAQQQQHGRLMQQQQQQQQQPLNFRPSPASSCYYGASFLGDTACLFQMPPKQCSQQPAVTRASNKVLNCPPV